MQKFNRFFLSKTMIIHRNIKKLKLQKLRQKLFRTPQSTVMSISSFFEFCRFLRATKRGENEEK